MSSNPTPAAPALAADVPASAQKDAEEGAKADPQTTPTPTEDSESLQFSGSDQKSEGGKQNENNNDVTSQPTQPTSAAASVEPGPASGPDQGDGNDHVVTEKLVSHIPEVVHQPANVEGSSIVSPLPPPQVDAPPGAASLQLPGQTVAVQVALAQPTLTPVAPPAARIMTGPNVVKKTIGRFNILQNDPIMETSDESGSGSASNVTAPSATAAKPLKDRQRVLSSSSVASQMSASSLAAAALDAVSQAPTVLVSSAATVPAVPVGTAAAAPGQVIGAASTSVVSAPASAPVVKKKGRFVVMPADAPVDNSTTASATEGLTRQSSTGVPMQTVQLPTEQTNFPPPPQQQHYQAAAPTQPQMQTFMVPVQTQPMQQVVGMEGGQMQGGVTNQYQVPMTMQMPQHAMQMAPGPGQQVMQYPQMLQFQSVPSQMMVQPAPVPDQSMQYSPQPIYHVQQQQMVQPLQQPQHMMTGGVPAHHQQNPVPAPIPQKQQQQVIPGPVPLQQQQTQPMMQPQALDQQSGVKDVAAPHTQQAAHSSAAQTQVFAGTEEQKAPRAATKAKVVPVAGAPRAPGATKATVPAHQRGASATGLGKVFYFLDQMKLEVTDADRTVKALQKDIKHLRARNKELEATSRNMEAKWIEEKNARETAEAKLKSVKKKFKEYKDSHMGVSEHADQGKSRSRANSVESENPKAENASNIAVSATGSAPAPPTTKEASVIDTGGNKEDTRALASSGTVGAEGKANESSMAETKSEKQKAETSGGGVAGQVKPEQASKGNGNGKSPPRLGLKAEGNTPGAGGAQKTATSPMNDPNRKRTGSNDDSGPASTSASTTFLHKSHPSASSLPGTTTQHAGNFDPLYCESADGTRSAAASPTITTQKKAAVPVVDFDPLGVNPNVVPVQMMAVSVPVIGGPAGNHHTRSYSESHVAFNMNAMPQQMLGMQGVSQRPVLVSHHASNPHLGYTAVQVPSISQPTHTFAANVQQPHGIQHSMYSAAPQDQPQLQPPPPPPQLAQQLATGPSDPFDELASRRTPQGTPNNTPQLQERHNWTGQ